MCILHNVLKTNAKPGKKIKELRLQKGITQSQLAEHCSTTQSVISRLEKNEEYADVGLLKRIAQVFAVDFSIFFNDDFVIHRRETEITPPILHKILTAAKNIYTKN